MQEAHDIMSRKVKPKPYPSLSTLMDDLDTEAVDASLVTTTQFRKCSVPRKVRLKKSNFSGSGQSCKRISPGILRATCSMLKSKRKKGSNKLLDTLSSQCIQ